MMSAARLGVPFIWLCTFCLLAQGQSPNPPATPHAARHFQWGTVSVSTATLERGGSLYNGGAQFEAVTMRDLIAAAYGLDQHPERVQGGPPWLTSDLYDLRAKAAAGATRADLQLMLLNFLKERFHLVAHIEQRPLPAYALTLLKEKPRLKPAADSEQPGGCAYRQPTDAEIAALQAAAKAGAQPRRDTTYDCTNETMARLAAELPDLAPAYIDNKVLDHTGLSGGFDFSLVFINKGLLRQPSAPDYDPNVDLSMDDALAALGLRLTPIQSPQTVVVVDSVAERPLDVPNSPVAAPPTLPTAFDVAEVKPYDPNSTMRAPLIRITPGGEVDINGAPLSLLLTLAFSLDPRETLGMPPWADSDRVSIEAKTVPGVTMTDIRPMLQNLLKQRFKLAIHQQTQAVPVFALRADAHPRLTPTKPGEGFRCAPSHAANRNVSMTCTDATLSQFVQNLYLFAATYLDRPVVDMTGIRGAYDISLTWAPVTLTGYNGIGAAPPTAGEPAVPLSGLTLFKAIGSLGLKLEHDKLPVQVTVIDHLERTPTPN